MMHLLYFFFFNDTATTEIYTLSLHDALPISAAPGRLARDTGAGGADHPPCRRRARLRPLEGRDPSRHQAGEHLHGRPRSEEHTSELQSHLNLVCRLLLEKKNQ